MPTRRGFLFSLLAAPFIPKALPVVESAPRVRDAKELHDFSIFSSLDGPASARFKAPMNTFRLGQRVTLSFGDVQHFDGVVDTVFRHHDANVETVECKDWASFSQKMGDDFTKRLMRDMRAYRVNL